MNRPYSYFSRLRTRHTRKGRIAALRRRVEAASEHSNNASAVPKDIERARGVATAERADAEL